MRLYIIRHGQSQNNALYVRTGSDRDRVDDPRLTEIGLRQAEVTATYLADSNDPVDVKDPSPGYKLTHLYTSLMHRAVSTGMPIAQKLNLPLHGWKDWHENGGIYQQDSTSGEYLVRPGMAKSDFHKEFPELILEDSIDEHGWWNRPYEAEESRPVRARRVLQELFARHGGSDDRVAVVSHGGFFNQFMAAVLGLEQMHPVWFHTYNCAITRFDFARGDHGVVFLNHVSHLPKDMIT